MLFCDAYPVKKMLPLDRIASAHPCLGHDFEKCPLFRELVARLACGECEHAQQPGGFGPHTQDKEAGHASRLHARASHAAAARPAHR